MVDPAQIDELQGAVGQVARLRSIVLGIGDPSRLAGDPGALRALAGSHRDAAGGLLSAADRGRAQAAVLAGGPWQGAASDAFSGVWATMDGQVRDLAARHTQMATALDEIAGRADSLNRQVTDVVRGVDSWLEAAVAAIATVDVGAVSALLSGASAVLAAWRTLLPELEAFASGLAQRLEIDLGVSAPAPWPSPVGGVWPRGIPLPGRPGILTTTTAPAWPRMLITTPGPGQPRGVLPLPLPAPTPPAEPVPGLTGIPGLLGAILRSEEQGDPSPAEERTPPGETPPPPQEPPTLPKPPWAPPDAEWRGRGPDGSEQGGWFDPRTGEWIHPHPESPGHDPHYDVGQRGQSGYRRVYPDGRPDEVVA